MYNTISSVPANCNKNRFCKIKKKNFIFYTYCLFFLFQHIQKIYMWMNYVIANKAINNENALLELLWFDWAKLSMSNFSAVAVVNVTCCVWLFAVLFFRSVDEQSKSSQQISQTNFVILLLILLKVTWKIKEENIVWTV